MDYDHSFMVGFLRLPVRATLGRTRASGINTPPHRAEASSSDQLASFSHGDQSAAGVVEVGNALQYSVSPAMMSDAAPPELVLIRSTLGIIALIRPPQL